MQKTREVIQRLTHYKNVLHKLKTLGFVRVFSDNLADALGVSPAVVRKDFSVFGLAGRRRGGYRVDDLIEQLSAILGKDEEHKVVIVGCGKIGTALMNYRGFTREGIKVVAAFDVNPAKIDPGAPIPVLNMSDLGGVVQREAVRVAVMTVPDAVAGQVLAQLQAAGIRGVLNFAPISLKATGDCLVQNINIALEIENLFHFIRLEGNAATRSAV
jgi:redox-sensing transcriptional repressor